LFLNFTLIPLCLDELLPLKKIKTRYDNATTKLTQGEMEQYTKVQEQLRIQEQLKKRKALKEAGM
jgi:hypothetical protein